MRYKDVTIRLTDEEISALRELAEKQDLNYSNVLVQALRCYQAIVFEQATLQWVKEPKLSPHYTLQINGH